MEENIDKLVAHWYNKGWTYKEMADGLNLKGLKYKFDCEFNPNNIYYICNKLKITNVKIPKAIPNYDFYAYRKEAKKYERDN